MLRSDVLHALAHGALMAGVFVAVQAVMHDVDGSRDVVFTAIFAVVAFSAELVRRRRARRRTRVPDSTP